jgi:tetratricopeptide (TPR) repeat protein
VSAGAAIVLVLVGSVLLGTLRSLLTDEARAWLPHLAQALVRAAARRLPPTAAERYEEEWNAHLHELSDRPISAVLTAAHIRWNTRSMIRSLDVVALGKELGDRELVLRGHVGQILSLMERGDWVGADMQLAAHARLAEELGDPLHLWYVPLFQATRALLEGRLADAERLAGEAYSIGCQAQALNAEHLYAIQLCTLRAEQGQAAELEQSLKEFDRPDRATPVWRAAEASLLATLGRLDEAQRTFDALTTDGLADLPRDGQWLSTVALLVRTGAQLGDKRRTGELGDMLAPYADRAIVAGHGAACLGPVSLYAAIAAATAGRAKDAITYFEDALAMARRWGAEPMIAGIQLEFAEVLDHSNEPSVDHHARASKLRAEGLETARRLGLLGLQKRWDTVESAMV